MGGRTEVLAVVDAVPAVERQGDSEPGEPVVWWVNLAASASIDRLCGAWVLSGPARGRLPALVADRLIIATGAGREVLAGFPELDLPRWADPDATLAAVTLAIDELQASYEKQAAIAKGKLTSPSWPTPPPPLDLEATPAVSGSTDARVGRAMSAARWWARLCSAWSDVETERLKRPYLRSHGGPGARPLPVRLLPEAGA